MMTKGVGFEITVASTPVEYEHVVAEIYYNGKLFAIVSQERGLGVFDLETPNANWEDWCEEDFIRKVDLKGFQKILSEACQRLELKEGLGQYRDPPSESAR